jgi:flagellar protein FlbD
MRYNDTELVVNADLIELIEATPDTIITMTTGKKIMTRNSVDDIIEKIIQYRRQCLGVVNKPKSNKKK